MPVSTELVKVAMFAGAFMTAAVGPLRPIDDAICTACVLHGLSHALPSKCGVPKYPGLQTLEGGGGGRARGEREKSPTSYKFKIDLTF